MTDVNQKIETVKLDGSITHFIGYKNISYNLIGSAANEIIELGNLDDRAMGNDGDDDIYTYDGNDYACGGGKNDRIWAGKGDDILCGGADDNLLFGEEGKDTFKFKPLPSRTAIMDFEKGEIIDFTLVKELKSINQLEFTFKEAGRIQDFPSLNEFITPQTPMLEIKFPLHSIEIYVFGDFSYINKGSFVFIE